ncbi:hypothetical protein [Sulfuracidifex tepidarius]|uniref:Uncharacterized protein n=1 Tax=Sulfuracidifex tepidarius TaxID=1294262 RepID=A0A510DZR9_9CREN|nr:hypothetical protein [Sulfuracidifex tepidarius]BBG22949.1 hypothetical protein IC006_0233 [Sulfuracidifex tepidarius]BBG25709.1 hypothetical protein IC007_0214 [Sulfuracidifex tepidarius]
MTLVNVVRELVSYLNLRNMEELLRFVKNTFMGTPSLMKPLNYIKIEQLL